MKPTFERSIDVRRCIDFLESHEQLTYAEISDHLDRDVTGADRHVLTSARRHLEKKGQFFVVERGIGLVRADNGQVARLAGEHPISKIRRVTRRAQKTEVFVNTQELTAAERLQFSVNRVVLETIKQTTKRALRTKIGQAIERQDGELVKITQLISLPRLHPDSKK